VTPKFRACNTGDIVGKSDDPGGSKEYCRSHESESVIRLSNQFDDPKIEAIEQKSSVIDDPPPLSYG
jgi:hypothetical protein